MKKIGILCAADIELEPFLKRMEIKETQRRAKADFYIGSIEGREVVAAYSGVCKVNAAITAELMIEIFGAEGIINAGVAGGMSADVGLRETVIAERTVYHDVSEDILTEFHPWMPTVYFHAGKILINAARKYAAKSDKRLHFGVIATGEQFIADEGRAAINEKFSPLAVDMESAAVAHVCYANDIPFLSVRSISDTAEHSGADNFELNCEAASAISADVVAGIIREL